MIALETVARTLVFNEHDQVLLLTRSKTDEHAPGRLDLPGGSVENGEGFVEAAARETHEEVGISIPVNEFQLVYAGTGKSHNSRKTIHRLLFTARTSETTVQLSDEHSDYEWVSLDEAIERFQHEFYTPGMQMVLQRQLLPQ